MIGVGGRGPNLYSFKLGFKKRDLFDVKMNESRFLDNCFFNGLRGRVSVWCSRSTLQSHHLIIHCSPKGFQKTPVNCPLTAWSKHGARPFYFHFSMPWFANFMMIQCWKVHTSVCRRPGACCWDSRLFIHTKIFARKEFSSSQRKSTIYFIHTSIFHICHTQQLKWSLYFFNSISGPVHRHQRHRPSLRWLLILPLHTQSSLPTHNRSHGYQST